MCSLLAAPPKPPKPLNTWRRPPTSQAYPLTTHPPARGHTPGDPFKGLLDSGGAAPGAPPRPDPVLDAPPGLAANFTAADAASLLDVVLNRWGSKDGFSVWS